MDERATDKLLSELFQRNAASVNEPALRDRINGKLWRIRKRRRSNRTAKIVAVGFASVVLVVAAVFATLRATEYFQDESPLVFTDLTPGPADAAAGWGTDNPAGLARVAPVMGTAVLEQTKDEGTSEPPTGAGSTQWIRDRVEVYRLSTSQPLVSGTMEITFDVGMQPEGNGNVEGAWVLRTDQGTWEGSSWRGIVIGDGPHEFYRGLAAGTGGLEGLILVLQWHVSEDALPSPTVEGSSESIAVSGWIQAVK